MKEKLALTSITSFSLGILTASFYKDAFVLVGVGLLISAICFGAWFVAKRGWYLYPSFLLLFLCIGIIRFSTFDTGARPHLEERLETQSEFQGVVMSDPDIRESTERLLVYVPEEQTHIVVVVSRYPGYAYGDILHVKGKLEHPKPFETDGGRTFNYDAFLAKDGVSYVVNLAKVEKQGEQHNLVTQGVRILYDIKHGFAGGLQEALPEPASSLAEGILVGGKQGLGKELLDIFTVTGLLPIIVLSGYNVMIVAEAILLSFGFLRKRYALVLSGIVISLFVLMAGAGSSAVRAGLMAVLALFAQGTGRRYDALRILLFVFTAMLLWNPYQLPYDPGFQFSFIATLGLILLSGPLEARCMIVKNAALREVIATTLSAQLFVLPLLLYQTGNLSFVSVPANILALVAVPAAMLTSLIAGIGGILAPSLAVWIGLPAYVLLSYIISVATIGASLPFAHVIIPEFPVWVLTVLYALLSLMVYRMTKQTVTSPE